MKTYAVTIQAIITKDILVEAEDEDKAVEQAHEQFSVLNDGDDEYYEQETLSIKERES